ncbi:MAG TPA: ferric reductase-like transmembrane domain-containing protein [Anaerolineaceae bacterium]|nr:ferric reductase-like transmembrane domain-containing protein [Anaerolineaceae bacterium]
MKKNRIRLYVYLLAAGILLVLLAGYLAGWLGDYPVRNAQLLTGRIAFIFLLASLSITPLRTLTGNIAIGPLRKAFGLNAFYFAALHVLILVVLDYRLSFSALLGDFVYRQYFWPGAIAFLILSVLALTSLSKIKKAVRTAWKKIHMLVYPAGVLVLVHFSWIANGKLIPSGEVKAIPQLAAFYLAMLFALRLKPVKEAVIRWRKERTAEPVEGG